MQLYCQFGLSEIITLKAFVNLNILLKNLSVISSRTKAEIYAVVKANAYGHGMSVATFLQPYVSGFCVATSDEAIALERLAIYKTILIFAERAWLYLPADYENIVYTVGSLAEVKEIYRMRKNARFFVKINTGMNRLGCRPEELTEIMCYVRHNSLKCMGIYTHFFNSGDLILTDLQYRTVKHSISSQTGLNCIHCCASNVLHLSPRYHCDIVRVGLSLYGYGDETNLLKPAMKVMAPIVKIHSLKKGDYVGYGENKVDRDCAIAVVRAGYGDGYRRINGRTRYVTIKGVRRPVVGQVCMDMFMVDLGDVNVKLGDEVCLLGEGVTAQELADEYGTSVYEILTSFNERAERVYVYE